MGALFFPRTPVLFADFSEGEMAHDWADFLEGLTAVSVTALIVPPAGKRLPERPGVRYVAPAARADALAAADFALVFHGGLKALWEKGCVPIAPMEGDATVNYNPLQEKGNGFYFKKENKWDVFAAVVRALETYQFPYDWENLIREITK